jgi:hypothetical protein
VQVSLFDLLFPVHRPGSYDEKPFSLGSGPTLLRFVSPEPGRGRAAACSLSSRLTSLTLFLFLAVALWRSSPAPTLVLELAAAELPHSRARGPCRSRASPLSA